MGAYRTVLLVLCAFFCITMRTQGQVEVLVHLESDARVEELLSVLPVAPREKRLLSKSWNIWLLSFTKANAAQLLKTCRASPRVKLAQVNHRIQFRSYVPNDPLFPEQWNLLNTGQFQGLPGADVKAVPAWELANGGVTASGDSVVIAVVDQGADLLHPDIPFWKNRHEIKNNGIDDDQNGYIDDYDGWHAGNHSGTIPPNHHGSLVCGIAAATCNNATGICGVAWGARILPVALSDYGDEAQVVEAYSYIYDLRKQYAVTGGAEGAFIVAVNSSFGIDYGHPEDYPIWCAMYDSLGNVGILSVVSTANLNINIDTTSDIPSSCPSEYLIVVTNTTRFDRRSPTAAYGAETVDLGAPGTGILSTGQFGIYTTSSGTSMAAPHVSAAVALLYSGACRGFIDAYKANPSHGALIVKDYVLQGADILSDLDGRTVANGRLNLHSSVNMLFNDLCVGCFTISAAVVPTTCNSDHDGVIILFPLHGAPPYTYLWSDGSSNSYLTGLRRGKYWVKVTDSTGCSKYRYFEMTSRNTLMLTLIADSSVHGANGSVRALVSGGLPPYRYEWNDSLHSTTPAIESLSPGTYAVTVTDSNGCQISDSVVVADRVISKIFSAENMPIHVWVNQDSGTMRLSLPHGQPSGVWLSDISGKMLLPAFQAAGTVQVDLSSLAPGIYLLKVLHRGNVIVRKVFWY
ncbi:MAG: hypothetical protein KatS3mg031_1518 [Chitinophagales bacterium]|nr:MAG: hypothetical protein KatS3mg031_1518 [Chitinophagales bacterium]